MIGRYSRPEMASLFTDEARFAAMLEVELLATEAWAELGVVPAEDAAQARALAPEVTPEVIAAIAERERVTDHDTAAFVDVIASSIGSPAGKWIHYGLTSSDVVDTAQCWVLTRATDVLLSVLDGLIVTLKRRAREFASTPAVGRTHGIHAEPTTFGAKLALWCLQADRDRDRLRAARRVIAVGKLSGAVGTYSNIDPAVEGYVCRALGLTPVPATQVIARDRHAELVYACAAIGTTIELIATEVRHLQRTEVAEVSEPFRAGQKGSSAMPHKRNPVKSEQLSGQARVLRGYLVPALEDVALWHERDISHSSVERIILPDAMVLAHYMVVTCTRVIDGLVVDDERMRANFDLSYGLVFSQPVLLALVAAGMARDDAYRIVQRDAQRAWDERRPFRAILEEDRDVTNVLKPAALDEAFDLDRALRNAHRAVDALDAVA
ncbi:MAG TPA: adenylosuccinate lyase [Acidimicrobiales bacterium]|nr:adenylosuccinate lyase [Acidimicrobiales bacterium]